jgi:FtsP/CotA-like multicopper oxidase with cupredoxin domain
VLNASDQLQREAVPAGTTVRLRLFNTDHTPHTFTLAGTDFRVTAVDGGPVNEPTAITGQRLKLGGGGRYDVEFTMPAAPVRLVDVDRPDAGLLISQDGKGDRAADTGGAEFDPTTYGSPLPVPFDAGTRYDQSSTWYLDDQFGFFDGRFTVRSAVNGLVFPDVPPIQVREGELVKMRFVNRSFQDHPMHLHGHHVLVLSRNDEPVTGSPLWLDTVNVPIGEVWEIAFKADNPGLWMDHCHNLDHAANGMVMHLTYAGYTTPFLVGGATPNQPE